ncbi:polyprenyl synthetase family protein [Paenibacillus sp. UNC451MF]|uniref:polyprenyl synthetase family protein n=1 Tax=Paenibacillus sp. UNC451MF TaxID=1449063 RepID=UPI00049060D8|nr:class 1 isoprenoid biosynthesis enzyme [Paenibacillus sp. UNC451MF]
MNQQVLDEMYRIVDRCIHTDDLNGLMKSFIAARAEGGSVWAELAECSHRMLGGQSPHITKAAALAELIMLTLDIVDDLQDRDKEHKVWMKCPETFTLNAVLGFLMVFMGEIGQLQLHAGQTAPLLTTEVSQLIVSAVNGQQKDINPLVNIKDESDYFNMVQLKSGSLIRLACYMGYSLVESQGEEISGRIDELAYSLGVIAQIENDVNNLEQFKGGNDLLQRKRTLPILYMLSQGRDSFPELIQFYEGEQTAEAFMQESSRDCLEAIADSGCLEYARIIQSLYYDKAEELFESIPGQSPWRERFRQATLGRFGTRALGNNG